MITFLQILGLWQNIINLIISLGDSLNSLIGAFLQDFVPSKYLCIKNNATMILPLFKPTETGIYNVLDSVEQQNNLMDIFSMYLSSSEDYQEKRNSYIGDQLSRVLPQSRYIRSTSLQIIHPHNAKLTDPDDSLCSKIRTKNQ